MTKTFKELDLTKDGLFDLLDDSLKMKPTASESLKGLTLQKVGDKEVHDHEGLKKVFSEAEGNGSEEEKKKNLSETKLSFGVTNNVAIRSWNH